jgi:pSer/pThr/pTyr-binding forkhead associated (FHA) protein
MDTQTKDQNPDNEIQNQTDVTSQTTTEALPKNTVKKEENIKYELVVCDNSDKSETTYPLENDKELIIGADPTCSISIEDEYLSFKHFSVRLKKNKVKVKDLSSKNGLFLSIDNLMRILPGQTLFAGKKFFKIREAKGEQ